MFIQKGIELDIPPPPKLMNSVIREFTIFSDENSESVTFLSTSSSIETSTGELFFAGTFNTTIVDEISSSVGVGLRNSYVSTNTNTIEGSIRYEDNIIQYYNGTAYASYVPEDYRGYGMNPFLWNKANTYNIVHVSVNGDDSNNGKSLEKAFLTIQAAIDSLPAEGGAVLVYPGSYSLSESILVDTLTDITLIGVTGAKNTIITRPLHSVSGIVYRLLTVSESPTFYCNGFTFENGYSDNTYTGILPGTGGGVLLTQPIGGSPAVQGATVEDCIIQNCYAQQYGGGIHCDDKKTTISRSIVRNCIIGGGGGGAGISLRWEGYAFNCLVIGCTTDYGAILCRSGICRAYYCTVTENTGGLSAGGFVLLEGDAPGHQIYNCITFNNTVGQYSVLSGSADLQGSVTAADPLFKDPTYGDFTLQTGSPALGLGIDLTITEDLNLNKIRSTSPDAGSYQFTPLYITQKFN